MNTRISYEEAVKVLHLLKASDDPVYVWVVINDRNPQCLNYGEAWTADQGLQAVNAANTIAEDLGQNVVFTVYRKEI